MSIKFLNVVKYHQDVEHQSDVWQFFQASVPKEILDDFAKRYRIELNQFLINQNIGVELP